jgi:hypothetical protein
LNSVPEPAQSVVSGVDLLVDVDDSTGLFALGLQHKALDKVLGHTCSSALHELMSALV